MCYACARLFGELISLEVCWESQYCARKDGGGDLGHAWEAGDMLGTVEKCWDDWGCARDAKDMLGCLGHWRGQDQDSGDMLQILQTSWGVLSTECHVNLCHCMKLKVNSHNFVICR